jgi:hypothetical protein
MTIRASLSAKAAATALALATLAGIADAHSYVFTLGAAAGATHYFGVICSSDAGYDTDHLLVQIQTDTPGAPLVSAQVVKGNLATNTTDPVSGDAQPGPPSRTRGGNGLYQVLINKSGPGAVTFIATAHCLDVSGTQHTGTDGLVYQYQPE